jgi:hypothetical protein
MSFDIDDGDREHYYRQYGKPEKRWPALRRSRLIFWASIAAGTLLLLFLISRFNAREASVDWNSYAYSLYATDAHSLCNAILVFDSLKRLGSRAERVLLYPQQWDTYVASNTDRTSQLLKIARDDYNVNLMPIGLLGQDGATQPAEGLSSESSWDASITKLRAFDLTPWKRVLHLDADITLLKNLDHLFLLPSAPVAMPRAYWADVPAPDPNLSQPWPLTSLLLLLEPSRAEFSMLLDTLREWRTNPNVTSHGDGKKYDMDLLNYQFGLRPPHCRVQKYGSHRLLGTHSEMGRTSSVRRSGARPLQRLATAKTMDTVVFGCARRNAAEVRRTTTGKHMRRAEDLEGAV